MQNMEALLPKQSQWFPLIQNSGIFFQTGFWWVHGVTLNISFENETLQATFKAALDLESSGTCIFLFLLIIMDDISFVSLF